jgi:hypothetical protein
MLIYTRQNIIALEHWPDSKNRLDQHNIGKDSSTLNMDMACIVFGLKEQLPSDIPENV